MTIINGVEMEDGVDEPIMSHHPTPLEAAEPLLKELEEYRASVCSPIQYTPKDEQCVMDTADAVKRDWQLDRKNIAFHLRKIGVLMRNSQFVSASGELDRLATRLEK